MKTKLYLIYFFILIFTQQLTANIITLQGKLTRITGEPITGNYWIKVEFFESQGSDTAIWSTEKLTYIEDGFYSIEISPTCEFNENTQYWVKISIKPQDGSDYESFPKYQLTYSPYAYYAKQASKATQADYATGIVSTSAISMGGNPILDVSTMSVSFIISTSPATTPLRISTSVYIVGYASATKFYGDGSGLYNVVASSLTSGNYLNEVMVSSAVYAEVLGGKTSDYFAIKSEVASSTTTLVTLSSTQTITAAKTFTSSVVVQNILDVYELKVTTINATDTTPYGGITITSNVFVDIGNVGIGTMKPQASLHVVSTDTISTILKLQTREISETVVVVSTSGNLGVGTENPEAKLDIQQTDTTQAYSVKIGTSPTSYHLVVSTTGNVGIGKTPSQELERSGKSGNVEAASCILRPDSYKVGTDTPPVTGMLIFYNSDVYVSTGTNNAWDWKKLQWTNP